MLFRTLCILVIVGLILVILIPQIVFTEVVVIRIRILGSIEFLILLIGFHFFFQTGQFVLLVYHLQVILVEFVLLLFHPSQFLLVLLLFLLLVFLLLLLTPMPHLPIINASPIVVVIFLLLRTSNETAFILINSTKWLLL